MDDSPVEVSEEIKAIHFEWTPELERIATSGGKIHPSIGPIERSDDYPFYIYNPDMTLPDPADTQTCLEWVGLSAEKIAQVEQRLTELYPDFQDHPGGYSERHNQNGVSQITYPGIEKRLEILQGTLDHWTYDFEETHIGYIKKGIQQGLRPEFAIFCGLHKDDPRAIDDPPLFEQEWFTRSPTEIINDFIIPFWIDLKSLMTLRLIHEGKAWADEHGKWLVHDGDIEKTKAKLDDKELERQREEAIEKRKRELELEEQQAEEQMALDEARWEEEERLEREAHLGNDAIVN